MRSVLIYFKDASRAEVLSDLNARFEKNGREWIRDRAVYIRFYENAEVELEPEVLEELRTLSGRKEVVAVMADISGRIHGDKETVSFCSDILSKFEGWAMDDYTGHFWTLEEIRSKTLREGHPFFDYDGWYEETKRNRNKLDGAETDGAEPHRI